MDSWSWSCFLDHFLEEFRTVAVVDFKDPGKYFPFVCSNLNIILVIMLRLLLTRMQKKKENGRCGVCCTLAYQIMISWYALSLAGAYDSTGEKLQIKGQCNLQCHMF